MLQNIEKLSKGEYMDLFKQLTIEESKEANDA